MKRHITNKISNIFGKFASKKFPKFIQTFINKSYVNILKLDMSEYDNVNSYKSLNELFTRKLVKKRQIFGQSDDFISPSDGQISEQGRIKDQNALQIKGKIYSISKLLSDYISKAKKDELISGSFINIYLSPKDYHRFHAPIDMQILKAIHVGAKLYPVNFRYLNKKQNLFCENERVILECKSKNDIFYLVFVGALNVGKMVFNFDKNIQTNAKHSQQKCYEYENLHVKKADELGHFQMGSTIVCIFENENIKFEKQNEKIKFGEILTSFN